MWGAGWETFDDIPIVPPAAMAAMGAGLAAMTAKLTYGVRRFESLDGTMRDIIPPLHRISKDLIPMIDADTNAFNEYMVGLAMPKGTRQEKALRMEKMQQGLKTAIEVPLKVMQLGDGAWEAMRQVARHGNPTCKSDVQVGDYQRYFPSPDGDIAAQGNHCKHHQGREGHNRGGQFKNGMIGCLRNRILFDHHLDRIGNGLQQSEFSGPVGTVANLQPRQELSFHQHQISRYQQQAYQNDQQFDQ